MQESFFWFFDDGLLQDHLGSTRVVVDTSGGVIVAESYDYFPFGLAARTSGGSTIYKFTEKELDSETDFYYFGARYYDAEVGRWLVPDPKAEKYPSVSPYVYCLNNPLILKDGDGRDVWGVHVGGQLGLFVGGGINLQFVYDTSSKRFTVLGSYGWGGFYGGGLTGELGVIYSPNSITDLLGSNIEYGVDISGGHGLSVNVVEGMEETENPVPIGVTKDGQKIYKMESGEKSTGKRSVVVTYSPGAAADVHMFKGKTVDIIEKIKSIWEKIFGGEEKQNIQNE